LTSQQVEKFSFENWISGSKTKGKKFLVATKSFVSPDCLVNMRSTKSGRGRRRQHSVSYLFTSQPSLKVQKLAIHEFTLQSKPNQREKILFVFVFKNKISSSVSIVGYLCLMPSLKIISCLIHVVKFLIIYPQRLFISLFSPRDSERVGC
jgi:hypothetical protein